MTFTRYRFLALLLGLFLVLALAITAQTVFAQTSQSNQSPLSFLYQQLATLRQHLTALTNGGSTATTPAASATCTAGWPQELLASDGAPSDFFGYSVAVSGDVALIGARLDDDKGTNSGSAYVFRWNGSSWIQDQKLVASDGTAAEFFGTSVATDGNTVAVGAPGHLGRGAVYVFGFNGSSWVQQQKLVASDGASNDGFGSSVGLSGNVMAVGAYLDDDRGFDSGSGYVFRWSGASWVQEQKLLASDGASVDKFGFAVSASDDVILIGAYSDDDRGNSSGSAYVFGFNGSSWVQRQKLVPPDGAAYDQFGYAVAVSAGLAVVGANQDSSKGLGVGSAYVFRFNGSTWIQETELYGSDSATNDYFGAAVAISSDMVVIGAPRDDHDGFSDSGTAYVFRLNGSAWTEETKLRHGNGASSDYFGYAVGASGDRVMVGVYWDDNINGADAGSAHIFTETCTTPTNLPPVINAGPDQIITLPNTATLSGTVTDDGLPSGTLTTSWSQVSGPGTATFANPTALSTIASFFASGTYVLRLTATDSALTTTDDVVITVNPAVSTADITPPTTTITAPTKGATVSGTVTVSVTATDPIVANQTTSGMREVTLVIDNTLLATDTTSPYSFVWDTTTLPDGSHTIFATAEDQAGNQTTVSVMVTVNNPVIDNVVPTVAITFPLNNSTVARRLTTTITVSATDNVGVSQVRFYVNGTLNCTDALAPYTCAWKVGGKSGTTFRLDAQASDAAGHIGYSAPVVVIGR
ncbi:MAG: hypothetical protein HYT47_01250 [Candidatus Vogelbacteria bacterium]|nr:hypothetical protein [Candidatus Vogelbacteria bacterium]